MNFSTLTAASLLKTGTMIFFKYAYTVLENNFVSKTVTLKMAFTGNIVTKPYSTIQGFVVVS